MKAHVVALMFAISLRLLTAAPDTQDTPLSDAIAAFNKKALNDPIGAKQPPLTMDEVVAAILLWERSADILVSDDLFASFKRIAETKSLPTTAEFARLTGYDRGSQVFDVWSVRVRMKRADGSSYEFLIRERVVGSRTIREELERLSRWIDEEGVEKWVGGFNWLERKKELEARIQRDRK